MLDLYINGLRCDLFGDEEIVLNKSVNNIGDIEFRDGDYTENFDLPLTATNKLIFGNSQVLNSGSDIPYQRLTARVEVNGNIVSIGYAQLLESSEVYRIGFKGANADWFAEIGDKKLSDLNLDEYNHLWTATNVRDARANNTAWTDIYNYPNVDYGPWQIGPTVYWTDFYPALYEKFLVWKIFQEAGFTVTGDFWDINTDWSKCMTPFCARFVRDRKYELRNSGSWDTPVYILGPDPWGDFGAAPILYVTNTITSSDYNILNPTTPETLTILDNVTITFRFRLRFSVSGTGSAYPSVSFKYDDNGVRQTVFILDPIVTMATPTPAGSFTDYDETITVTMPRSLVQFYFISGVSAGAPIGTISSFQIDILDYIVNEEEDSYLGVTDVFNYITLSSTQPDILQKDLIRKFFNQFCIMCDTDHQTNYINLFSFNDVLGNIPVAKNWTNKIDYSRKPSLTYLFNSYAQTNNFIYKEDPENKYLLASPEFGNGEIEIDNENLDFYKNVFECEYSIVIRQSESFSGTVRMAYIPKFIGGEDVDCSPYTGVIEYESIHLVTMDGFPLEDPQPAMHELRFNYLIPTYYTALSNILTNSKVLNILLLLNSVDIQQLDFSIPVYLEPYQAYFYINQVKQFKLTGVESTLVELVRL